MQLLVLHDSSRYRVRFTHEHPTVDHLNTLLNDFFAVSDPYYLVFQHGFPIRTIPVDSYSMNEPLSFFGLHDGDALTVELLKKQIPSNEENNQVARHSTLPSPNRNSVEYLQTKVPYLRAKWMESRVLVSNVSRLMRVAVPHDNSCLFTTICYLLGLPVTANCLRELVGSIILLEKAKYPDSIFDLPREDYVAWITKKDSWGGYIELHLLAEFFGVTFVVVSCFGMPIVTFGPFRQGINPTIYIAYDGHHYDAIVGEEIFFGRKKIVRTFPFNNSVLEVFALSAAMAPPTGRVLPSGRSVDMPTPSVDLGTVSLNSENLPKPNAAARTSVNLGVPKNGANINGETLPPKNTKPSKATPSDASSRGVASSKVASTKSSSAEAAPSDASSRGVASSKVASTKSSSAEAATANRSDEPLPNKVGMRKYNLESSIFRKRLKRRTSRLIPKHLIPQPAVSAQDSNLMLSRFFVKITNAFVNSALKPISNGATREVPNRETVHQRNSSSKTGGVDTASTRPSTPVLQPTAANDGLESRSPECSAWESQPQGGFAVCLDCGETLADAQHLMIHFESTSHANLVELEA